MCTGTPTVSVPEVAAAAVLQQSEPVPSDAVSVEGPNFDNPLNLQDLLRSYERIGFQANSFGKAINIVNQMVCKSNCSQQLMVRHRVEEELAIIGRAINSERSR
jgi:deoxyhypusine synthase